MHLDSSTFTPSAQASTCHDDAAQELEDWAATIALTVACTLEPSCALAFCFGRKQDRPAPLLPGAPSP